MRLLTIALLAAMVGFTFGTVVRIHVHMHTVAAKADEIVRLEHQIIDQQHDISRKLDVCAPVVAAEVTHESRSKRRPESK